jgi:integrase
MAIGEVKPRTVKRPDGTTYKIYQGEYRDRDGERRHVSDKNKHEAQDKLRRAINEVKEWTHAKRKPRTLGQVIEEYLKDREDAAYIRKDISPDAYMRDKYVLSKVPEKLRRMKIAEFKDAGLFEELIKRLRTDGHAIRTVRAVLGGLSGVFAFAMKAPRGYVARNVLKDFPIRTPKPPKVRNKAEISDALLLLSEARDRILGGGGNELRNTMALPSVKMYAILSLLAATGVRPEEAFGLQVADIKRFEQPPCDRPTVWADVTIRNVSGRHGFRERTKTDEIRTVGVGRRVVEAFDEVERYWYVHEIVESPGWRGYWTSEKYRRRRMLLGTLGVAGPRREHGFMFVTIDDRSLLKYPGNRWISYTLGGI